MAWRFVEAFTLILNQKQRGWAKGPIRSFCAALMLALPAFSGALAQDSAPSDDMVSVLIKFVPDPSKTAPAKVQFLASSCPACVQSNDPTFERFNRRESVLYLRIPKERYLNLSFVAPPSLSRRVLINDTELPVVRSGAIATVALPPLKEDAIWAPAFETDLEEDGIVLRMEHADIERRGGAYATGDFPVVERKAADNLTFAMREAARRMGLGRAANQAKVGTIMIMGFDTNFPAGHTDAPPHVHMHLRWPNNIGTQIAHYYLDKGGLLTENKVGIRGLNTKQRTYAKGETFPTVDNTGRTLYSHTITQEGWLRLDGLLGTSCLFKPMGTGFDSGVDLDCGSLGKTTIVVSDNIEAGETKVKTGLIEEVIRYDRDTGKLLSPAQPPSNPPNARNPVW